ncbi:hypothetical protein PGT21_001935 [Puccinia graminis f. sp. tritici]|uniref:Uncharacterized protein n=1 Tax=Puccinia graminis f. sp. tritici TaxID=56615 RepID=A0A5B0RVK9_PUCGR|nr:hypothetical protein PGT21_001935 [Puccinia graminis f. sp. tritici]KAA1130001.1 hypothetical protein PGTUg99_009813 [Puccinia graminis f. sp. tritici]KAA1136991.1 hypothetical protein PGTUg99_010504 [Puccinia graminis f. sp. tritici]
MPRTEPPPLPPRLSHHHQRPQQQQPISTAQDIDEPPPAYTPSPENDVCVLEVGPQYPFGPSQASSPSNQTPNPTEHHHHQQLNHQAQTHHHHHLQPPPTSHHQQPNAFQNPTVPSPPFPALSEPTTVPTPGRPLLYEHRILVYPYVNGTAYFCPKCCNTGFKGFDPYRPCRKCWLKYGKPWQAVRLSPMTNSSPWTLQRPLPPTQMAVNPPPLVVRPGDPRIGGRLCLNCNGSGQKMEELTLFNVLLGGGGQEVCPSCRGTGRIFF